MKQKRTEGLLMSHHIENVDGKLYNVWIYRNKKGENEVLKSLYNPQQYLIKVNRNTFNGILVSTENGFNVSMKNLIENIENNLTFDRYLNQLQAYTVKLSSGIKKKYNELSDEEIKSMVKEKFYEFIYNYFNNNKNLDAESIILTIIDNTDNEILQEVLSSYIIEIKERSNF